MLRRCATATGVPVDSLIKMLVNFATTAQLEDVHPLQGGILPAQAFFGLPRERAFIFWDPLGKHAVVVATIARLLLLKFVITRDAAARMYKDTALTVSDDEETTLDLLTRLARIPRSRI